MDLKQILFKSSYFFLYLNDIKFKTEQCVLIKNCAKIIIIFKKKKKNTRIKNIWTWTWNVRKLLPFQLWPSKRCSGWGSRLLHQRSQARILCNHYLYVTAYKYVLRCSGTIPTWGREFFFITKNKEKSNISWSWISDDSVS